MLDIMDIENLVLRPNCLLTRYPLVFVTGPRSLFHHEKLGGLLQDFTAAHGYMVRSPAMPFRSSMLRRLYLDRWLRQQAEGCFHFILGENTHKEFADLWLSYTDSTFTIVPRDLLQIAGQEPLKYRLHRYFCRTMGTRADPYEQILPDTSPEFYDRFLDHCIELAENDAV